MKSINILIAEDDKNIRKGLIDVLESEGYNVIPAADGRQALKLFQEQKIDMLILDIMMPEKSGYDVCQEIRVKDRDVPIILLTAKGEEIDKVLGLKLGADDYVTKPFGIHELLARIDAVLRRSGVNKTTPGKNNNSRTPDNFVLGNTRIDARQLRGTRGNKTFDFSPRELKLLEYFYAHPNEAIDRNELLDAVWGTDYFGTTRTLDQHIAMLRKKIEVNPDKPAVIRTVHGLGYRYEKVK
ncbi:MAG: response regulator transcription factor [bacterium]